MKLVVATPTAVVVEADQVQTVRAEDATGCFGILPGHADLITALAVSVLIWTTAEGSEKFVAVRGGVLSVRRGQLIEVASREAVAGEDLAELSRTVVARMIEVTEAEAAARTQSNQLQVSFLRRMHQYIQGERPTFPNFGGPSLGAPGIGGAAGGQS